MYPSITFEFHKIHARMDGRSRKLHQALGFLTTTIVTLLAAPHPQMLSWQTNKVQLPLQDMSSSRCTTRTCAHSSSVPSYGRPTSTPTDVDFFCGDGEPELAVPVPRWTQARFSISLPPARGSDTSCRAVSRTVTNGLAPLLCEVESGVGLLQVLNRTVSLSVSPAEPSDADRIKLERPETRPEVEKLSPSSVVTLSIQAGEVTWGQKQHQELWLLYDGEGTGEEGKTGSLGRDSSPDSSTPIKKGSDRFDFLLLWSSVASTRDTLDTSGSEIRPRVVQQEDEDHDGSNGRWLPSESNPREYSRGGHLVGELRPLNAFSAERQASLNTVRMSLVMVRLGVVCRSTQGLHSSGGGAQNAHKVGVSRGLSVDRAKACCTYSRVRIESCMLIHTRYRTSQVPLVFPAGISSSLSTVVWSCA